MVTIGTCWHRRDEVDPDAFRDVIRGLCATLRSQAGVYECRDYWAGDDVRVETLAEEEYYRRPPCPEVARQLFRLSGLADYTGTFSW